MVITILSQTLYNAAGASNHLARYTGVGYLILSLFAAGWGYGVYVTRSRMIRERSGKDFDYVVGPIIVTVSFVVAVVLNFAFRVSLNICHYRCSL